METKVIESAELVKDAEVLELIELGSATQETKGGFIGHTADAGYGVQKP